MECYIHPFIDYSNISQIITKQKELLIERIKKLSLNEIAFSGAKYADLIDNAIDHEDPDVPRVDPLKIPGIKHSGWEREDYAELSK